MRSINILCSKCVSKYDPARLFFLLSLSFVAFLLGQLMYAMNRWHAELRSVVSANFIHICILSNFIVLIMKIANKQHWAEIRNVCKWQVLDKSWNEFVLENLLQTTDDNDDKAYQSVVIKILIATNGLFVVERDINEGIRGEFCKSRVQGRNFFAFHCSEIFLLLNFYLCNLIISIYEF